MAAQIGSAAGVPRGRPGGVVLPRPGYAEDPPRSAWLPARVGESARSWGGSSGSLVSVRARDRVAPAALSVLVAATSVAPAVCGQTADRDGGARAVIPTFSYTGELVQDAVGGARRGTAFAGAGAVQVTLLLGRVFGWHGARLFVFALGTHGGRSEERRVGKERRARVAP